MTVQSSGNDYNYHPACLFLGGEPHPKPVTLPYQGLQIHLPDFHADNSTYVIGKVTHRRCAPASRFGMYKHFNEMTCP
jgi:hypothetical protein